ncbi:TIGR03915 family putative DNA repair protein [uncultured Bacteroides sp.]|jgi:probable DNA metabolism protein|uniref:TIGR03915 family putative DNA repair protein n=1 Tax=uncultured Bacteroides sp. TaxID=162156 RepID=UPI00280A7028|nr:TIGR03915 family putative DNA repair protein [uncultured Bacteroides sp.]
MTIFQYDHTFEGLLTALFDAYKRKTFPDMLLDRNETLPLFYDEVHEVTTDNEKAERVWKALKKKLSRTALATMTHCWLSETNGAPYLLLKFMQKVVDAPISIETNFSDPDILAVAQLGKKVNDEKHRILQFMRFQKTYEGIYYGIMDPIYNVFPLTIRHFSDRFNDQQWLIYDSRRHYGYYYNGKEIAEITFASHKEAHFTTGKLNDDILDKDEKLFQTLWKSYFKAICIKERLNPTKHKKDMPVRYWKYLTEKN